MDWYGLLCYGLDWQVRYGVDRFVMVGSARVRSVMKSPIVINGAFLLTL